MSKTPSIPGLYLRYRIWIADMNADITILRIFDDYIDEFTALRKDGELKNMSEKFRKQFETFRKEMDELKHEMHLQKMKLAANTREGIIIDKKQYRSDNHADLKKRYYAFHKAFAKMKTEFGLIKDNWIS
ncbi:MAG: hypothetical protein V4685_11205 [Bacteroidota bacterium]